MLSWLGYCYPKISDAMMSEHVFHGTKNEKSVILGRNNLFSKVSTVLQLA